MMVMMLYRGEIAVLFGSFFVVATTSPMVTLTSNVTFDHDGSTLLCSSKPIQFMCIGTQLGFLAWKINSVLIEDYTLFAQTGSSENIPDGLTVVLTRFILDSSKRHANFTTTLTAETSALTDGDVVECKEGDSVVDSITVRYSRILELPPVPTGIQVTISAERGTTNLTLHWSESFTTAYDIEMYCVSGVEIETGSNCHGRHCVSSTLSYHCNGLRPGRYGFRVQAINCGDQLGEESGVLTIYPQLPASPNSCTCVAVYEQITNNLAVIQNTWSSVQNPPDIIFGKNQDITSYIISYTGRTSDGGTMETLTISANDVCTYEGHCAYNITNGFNSMDYYTISVSAVNLVGEGEPCVCSQEISSVNNIVTIIPNTVNQTEPVVTCHFTAVKPYSNNSDPVCSVCYGTGSPCHTSTCLPSVVATPVNGTDGYIANVSLTELEDGIHYQFQATASDGLNRSAIVVGTFSTACVSTDLAVVVSPVSTRGVNKLFIDQRCAPSDVGSLRTPHGVICYNGTSVGSVASYICDDGYRVSGSLSNQRTCLANGNWEGDILLCIEPQPGHLSVGGITGIVILTIATTLLGVVIGVLVYYVTLLTRKNRKLKETSGSTSKQETMEEIQSHRAVKPMPPPSSLQTQSQGVEEIVYHEGNGAVKYADVRRPHSARSIIDTRGNMAYQYGQVKQ